MWQGWYNSAVRPRTIATCAALAMACNSRKQPPRDAAEAPHMDKAALAIVATCADAQGSVDTRRKGEPTWEPARIGTTFRELDWVRTGDEASARLRFSDKRFIELPEHTTIIVDSEITIESGSLVAVASGGETLRVKAADGTVAQITPTGDGGTSELRLTPSKTKGLEIAVTKGTVRVITGAGEQAVAAGEASDLVNNRTTSVVKLLASPTLSTDAKLVVTTGAAAHLSWGGVPGAARYRVQVALEPSFRSRLIDRELTDPTLDFTPDKPGAYVWRVASIDEQGRVGPFGEVRRLEVAPEPPPELLFAPANGAKIGFAEKSPAITFVWRAAAGATQYRLVVVRGTDMASEAVATLTTPGLRAEVRTLREGTYHWGVYAVGEAGESPIFGAPRTLTIRKQRVKVHTDKLWQRAR